MRSVILPASHPAPVVYPILMEVIEGPGTPAGLVVLFTGKKTGFAVKHSNDASPNFEVSDNWIDANDTSVWKRFNGTVGLSNS